MSQIIVAQSIQGIVLAAENRATQLDDAGKEISLRVNRLLPLTSHCALLTAGAPEGGEMGGALKQFILEEALTDIQDIYNASLAFLSTEFNRFMRKKCELLPIDPIHQVSFVLAGRTKKTPRCRFAFITSGRRRSFLNWMGTRSPVPSRFQEGWGWSSS